MCIPFETGGASPSPTGYGVVRANDIGVHKPIISSGGSPPLSAQRVLPAVVRPARVILEQEVFPRDSSLRSRMTARKNFAAKDLGRRRYGVVRANNIDVHKPNNRPAGLPAAA